MKNSELTGRSVVVTGGAQGLGRALVERFLEEGCRVVVGDLQDAQLQTLSGELSARYAQDRIVAQRCDVAREPDVEALVATALSRFGGVDAFIANAGILISGPLVDFDVDKWRKVMEVNLIGQMLCMKHALRAMSQAGHGAYVQINSKSGKKGSFKNSAYAASKFGAIGLMQSAALEMAERGVRVNAVCPGNLLDSPLWKDSLFKQYALNQGVTEAEIRRRYIDQVPMKRSCQYEDVCNVVAFLTSDAAGYMTGQAINVTGGQEMR